MLLCFSITIISAEAFNKKCVIIHSLYWTFYIWDYLKNRVHQHESRTNDETDSSWSDPNLIRNAVLTNFRTRLERCLRLNRHNLSDVIFKNEVMATCFFMRFYILWWRYNKFEYYWLLFCIVILKSSVILSHPVFKFQRTPNYYLPRDAMYSTTFWLHNMF